MALNENNELVSSSKYDIYSKLVYIASKYFDVQNEDFLKSGLFGYILESMAMITRDSSFQKTMMYNESFLNTAVMPKSVYNWAKMFGVSVPTATPAYAEIQVTIPLEALIFTNMTLAELNLSKYQKYGQDLKTLEGKDVIIIDRGNSFLAGQLTFFMERSVFLYKDVNSTGPINVKYCQTEEMTTRFQALNNFFIKSIVQDNYISFIVRAYQYEIKNIDKQITSSSFLDTKIHKFQFVDQFVTAKLSYVKSGRTLPIELRFSNIQTLQQNISNKDFAYYNLVDEETLQITFSSNAGDFIPSSNSVLKLQMYTTKGGSGNITFTGDVIFRFQEESLKNIPVLANFFEEASFGGVDTPDISRLKSTIINEISTRDVIVTETDLNNYFLILTALLETVNDGKITFIKKRDDILRRVFSAYILMRDGLDLDGKAGGSNYVSKVIPTNTIDADFAISSNMSKPFGSIIKRKSGTLNNYEYVASNALDGSDDYYVIPFYLRVNLEPFRKVKYIYNLTDDSTSLSFNGAPSTNDDLVILPSTISVRRGLEGTNANSSYIVSLSFVSNRDFSALTDADGEFKMSFIPKNSTAPREGKSFTFTRSINGGTSITSTKAEDGENRFNVRMDFFVKVNSEVEFNFSEEESSSNYGTFINVFHNDVLITLPEEVKISMEFSNIFGSGNFSFISDRTLLFFRNLDELMFSDIKANTSGPQWNSLQNRLFSGTTTPTTSTGYQFGDYFFNTSNSTLHYLSGSPLAWSQKTNTTTADSLPSTGTNEHFFVLRQGVTPNFVYSLYQYDSNIYVSSVTIKDIPVVHQKFFNSEANKTKFIRQLFVYIDTLKENLGKLESNTFFDLKFYNTYGPSQYYNSLRTDMEIELDVYVFEYSDTLASAIRDYVRLLVDSFNRGKSLRISTLIKELTSSFGRYIDHVDFKGLNGTFTQFIKEDTTILQNLHAPEHFNIPLENISKINIQEIADEE